MATARTSVPAPDAALVALAAALAPDLEKRAGAHDEADELCDDDFDDLIASGYTAITVPAELGGRGANALDLVAAQARLAQASPSTALAVNMHLHGVGILAELLRAPATPFLAEAARGAILAGGFSEPQSGGNWWYQATTATPAGGGWRLDGTKSFFSGWPRATHLLLTASVVSADGREPIAFLVPKPDHGIEVVRPWRGMGMRASGSDSVRVDGLVVGEDCVIGRGVEVALTFLAGAHWAWLSFASVFLGVAEAAYAHVVGELPARRNEGLGGALSDLSGVQQAVGEMRMRLDAARAALFAAAVPREIADPVRHYGEMAATKLFVCTTALEVCTLALRTAGGTGYLRGGPLERLLRDAHAGMLLPPSHDATLQWLGRVELGALAGPPA